MNNFGTGPTLREASPHLRDDAQRHERILDVAERNSVIEGLPPFSEELRVRLLRQLAAITPAKPQTAHSESPQSSVGG
jgi:hypothetical protein